MSSVDSDDTLLEEPVAGLMRRVNKHRRAHRNRRRQHNAKPTDSIADSVSVFVHALYAPSWHGDKLKAPTTSVRHMRLAFAPLSKNAITRVIASTNRLITLDLSFSYIGNEGAELVAQALLEGDVDRGKQAGTLSQLKSLQLSHNDIGERGASAICQVIKSCQVHF